jgi:hypothetical protein
MRRASDGTPDKPLQPPYPSRRAYVPAELAGHKKEEIRRKILDCERCRSTPSLRGPRNRPDQRFNRRRVNPFSIALPTDVVFNAELRKSQ